MDVCEQSGDASARHGDVMTRRLLVSVPENGDDQTTSSRNFEVRQLGTTSSLDESGAPPQVDLDVSYQNAFEQIQKLELQLSRRGEYDDL